MKTLKIGLYSAGLRTYWNQFPGLKERMEKYNRFIEEKLSAYGEVFNFGIADNADMSQSVADYFQKNLVDIIFLHSATYFTSDTVLPIHRACKVPAVVLNLQPSPQINYEKTDIKEWLCQCVACPVPEVANTFERAGIPFRCVNGLLGLDSRIDGALSDEVTASRPEAIRAWHDIEEWCLAAKVKKNLENARFGFLGNNYSGMLDMYSDLTLLSAKLGIHSEIIEMCDLDAKLKDVTDSECEEKLKEIYNMFRIVGEASLDPSVGLPSDSELLRSAQIAAAQAKLVQDYALDGLAYYYHSTPGNPYEELQSGLIVGNSLLTASGVPCAGEADIKTAVGMKICDLLGAGGSFSEIVATDYINKTILIGHDGPFHIKISNGKPLLRSMGVYHGKRGCGVSVEAKVRPGDVTILNVTQTGSGNMKFIVTEAESLDLPIMMIGNTQTHIRFNEEPDAYMEKWFAEKPTHHCVLAVGHIAGIIRKLGKLMNIETVVL